MSLLQEPTSSKLPKQQCKAHSKRSGKRCTNPPIRGGTVCRMHGGAAPQVRAKAEAQLKAARDELMEILLEVARRGGQAPGDQLKAVTWGLERAGFRSGIDIGVEAKVPGYQKILEMFADDGSDDDPAAGTGRVLDGEWNDDPFGEGALEEREEAFRERALDAAPPVIEEPLPPQGTPAPLRSSVRAMPRRASAHDTAPAPEPDGQKANGGKAEFSELADQD